MSPQRHLDETHTVEQEQHVVQKQLACLLDDNQVAVSHPAEPRLPEELAAGEANGAGAGLPAPWQVDAVTPRHLVGDRRAVDDLEPDAIVGKALPQ